MRIFSIICSIKDFVHKYRGFCNYLRFSCCFYRENFTKFSLYPAALEVRALPLKKTAKIKRFLWLFRLFRNYAQQLRVIGKTLEDFEDAILFQSSHAVFDGLRANFGQFSLGIDQGLNRTRALQ